MKQKQTDLIKQSNKGNERQRKHWQGKGEQVDAFRAQQAENKTPVGSIDCTPTWESVVLIHAVEYGEKSSLAARDELLLIARLADERNAMVNKAKRYIEHNRKHDTRYAQAFADGCQAVISGE